MSSQERSSRTCNVLVSSCGRRVGLIECFRESLHAHGIAGAVYGIDTSSNAPAFHLADRAWLVPRCSAPEFPGTVLDLARLYDIGLIVPTIDPELPVWAAHRERFQSAGIMVASSSRECCAICGDKWRTYEWLRANGFATVRTLRADSPDEAREWSFPLIAKPVEGSASIGVRRIGNPTDLATVPASRDVLIQEVAGGLEYTINVFVDGQGKCLAAVPHQRLEVRAGEVSKARTHRDPALIELGTRIAEQLPDAFGALNIQGFLDTRGVFRVVEINARFGGGYPLTHQAGARFTDWLILESLGQSCLPRLTDWTDGMAMLRYDAAVFTTG
jgi:carbamoyl-phosphate synthase large subunit